MKYKNILFDLDGTITDSSPGIINSYLHSLTRIDLAENDIDMLRSYIGSPLRAYYTERHNMSTADSDIAVKHFREHYAETGLFENTVYPGMDELIHKLHDSGFRLYIATSKPLQFAITVLDHFNLKEYFNSIHGSDMSADNKPKDKLIADAILMNGLIKSECVMIGDRYHDINGAKVNGIDSIAVTYGYGSMDELAKLEPVFMAANTRELTEIFFPN
ncbi:MAG TPA: HAD-IA family hydrolase [Ignavibacteria bacterium]|mgnify:FL=1|nr:HAD-IA family hydrolase [Ignavibacteria bacterium]HRJ04996.1 HAD-IA family hydrolase [Ignavibacteria bacterium]HRJ85561.1 HAD-IA family hydrolase [Ignavibacteria bacterium]